MSVLMSFSAKRFDVNVVELNRTFMAANIGILAFNRQNDAYLRSFFRHVIGNTGIFLGLTRDNCSALIVKPRDGEQLPL